MRIRPSAGTHDRQWLTSGSSNDNSMHFAPSSININPVQSPQAQKRKHDEFSDQVSIGEPFLINAHPLSSSGVQTKLVPLVLIHRSCLPLAYLDSSGGIEKFGSRLFSAHIAALDPESSDSHPLSHPSIMIARSEASNSIYAVENVQADIYALCKLGDWVALEDLQRLHTLSWDHISRPSENCERRVVPGAEWWRSSAIGRTEVRQVGAIKKQRLKDLDGLRLRLRAPSNKVDQVPYATLEANPQMVSELASPTLGILVDEPDLQNLSQQPEEVLKMVMIQYQEALYISKTSLAYFAKGPLSRARATFHGSVDLPANSQRLVESLRTNILSLTVMDKKYRETLPGIVKSLPFRMISEDDSVTVVAACGKKSRKSKKFKIGKDSLYPGEAIYITRWWLSRDKPAVFCDSPDANEEAVRTILLEQRARETQLQIILVLETLALEASTLENSLDFEVLRDAAEEEMTSQPNKPKPKKPQDLLILLDLLVDRLCIWHSMNVDEDKTSRKGGALANPHVERASDRIHLQGFYVDVVLPFYGARLPHLSSMLCQKLGGPTSPSPVRPLLAKAASTSQATAKPGAVVQRFQARKPRRTLERVLTDERSATQKPSPSLLRSATDSLLPHMKRETSETSLLTIPPSRLNIQKSKRYSQREVDMKHTSQAAEARLKKKASVEQELKGAIDALKRPNPRMVVKELVEAAEKRAAGPHARKPKNPMRNLFAQGVQVMATPRGNRQKDVFGGLPPILAPSKTAPPEPEETPPSSGLRMSSSSLRGPDTLGFACNKSSIAKRCLLPIIEQTPTRGPSKFTNITFGLPRESEADKLPRPFATSSKPCQTHPPGTNRVYSTALWTSEVDETPSKGHSSKRSHDLLRKAGQVTPVKSLGNVVQTSIPALEPPSSPPATEQLSQSIYASLGWDDVDELL